ncbi:MAG: conjugal transfer protein TraF, partial [Gammaproteobacteria bacterium]
MNRLSYKIIYFILLTLLTMNLSVYASENDYYKNHAKGWHWYDDPKKQQDEDENEESSDPVAQMDTVRATIKRALDQAVLKPTQENVIKYKIIQDQLSRQADKFSNVWREIKLEHPELDYSLIHPTNNAGRMIESDQIQVREDQAIKKILSKNGLFFFYRSTCPYCRAFAPIVKQFA